MVLAPASLARIADLGNSAPEFPRDRETDCRFRAEQRRHTAVSLLPDY
jgi:hypothetical protein